MDGRYPETAQGLGILVVANPWLGYLLTRNSNPRGLSSGCVIAWVGLL
jgi:hypothetical protein